MGDGGGLEDFGAECAGGVARGFLGKMCDLGRGEDDGVQVGAAGVGIFAVARAGLGCFGEIHQDLPESGFVAQGAGEFLQRVAGFGDGISCDAERMARRRAAGFEDYFGAILRVEGAVGIGVGIFGENFGERGGIGIEGRPPVAEGMEDDGAGAEDLLDAGGIFSGDLDDHVNEFWGAEGLADQRAHAEIFGFFFGVFYGDGFGKRHSTCLI